MTDDLVIVSGELNRIALCVILRRSLTTTVLVEQAVKPMLQERTKRKVQVLRGNGRDELLQVKFCPCSP